MARISSYHRPSTLSDALALLARPDVHTAPLGGGTVLNADPRGPDEVIDLQDLGLNGIDRREATVTVGAMVTVQEVATADSVPPVLRELARKSAPNTIRNMATMGGTVAAGDWENILLAGLLAFEATVTIAGIDGPRELPLAELLADRSLLPGAIITAVAFDSSGTAAFAGTGRTPADTPIVLVCARQGDEGAVSYGATGVAATPTLVDPESLDQLNPPADFRGSAAFRRHLVETLAARVTAKLEESR